MPSSSASAAAGIPPPSSGTSSPPSPSGGGGGAASTSATTTPHSARIPYSTFTSSLPLAITLHVPDLPASAWVDPTLAGEYVHYTTIRRNTYLPLLLREVKEALVGFLVAHPASQHVKDKEMWFEYKGAPLRWHWPVGLLYDFHVGNLAPSRWWLPAEQPPSESSANDAGIDYFSTSSASTATLTTTTTRTRPRGSSPILSPGGNGGGGNASTSRSSTLPRPPTPWTITLRLRNLPAARLPPPSNNALTTPAAAAPEDYLATLADSSKQAYMSLLKEADFVRNGNTKKVNNLRRGEQDGIWDALTRGDYAAFAAGMARVLPPASAWPSDASGAVSAVGFAATAERGPRPSAPPSSFHMGDAAAGGADSQPGTPVPARASSLYGNPNANSSSASLAPSIAPSVAPTITGVGASGEDGPGSGGGDKGSAAEGSAATQSAPTPAPGQPRALKGMGTPGLKAVPVKFVLQGGAVLLEGVPPLTEDGRTTSLFTVLNSLFPALFPLPTRATTHTLMSPSLGLEAFTSPLPGESSDAASASASATATAAATSAALALPIVQGIQVPLDASLPWLGRCMAGADGWLTILLLLVPNPSPATNGAFSGAAGGGTAYEDEA